MLKKQKLKGGFGILITEIVSTVYNRVKCCLMSKISAMRQSLHSATMARLYQTHIPLVTIGLHITESLREVTPHSFPQNDIVSKIQLTM